MLPKRLQNDSRIDPEACWRALGAVLAAWRPLGGVLDSSWRPPRPEERALERLLSALRRIPRLVSAILQPKKLPKRSPGGSKMVSRRRLELKRPKSQNLQAVPQKTFMFDVPGLPFRVQNRVQNLFPIASSTLKASKSLLRASRRTLGASWRPLGALLEASGAGKKILRAALGRSTRNLKTGFSHLGGQKAPPREPGRVQNGVQNRFRIESGEITKNEIHLSRKPYF